MNISKEVCLGLVASLVGKPDLCLEHFLKAVVKCHSCGILKLLRHLFTLLFPFGLESWDMIKRLSGSSLESRSKNVDQLFHNVIAFYYRTLLNETLVKCNKAIEQHLVQDLTGKGTLDEGCVEGPRLARDNNVNGDIMDQEICTGPSRDNFASNIENVVGLDNASGTQVGSAVDETDTVKDISGESICTMGNVIFDEIYEIALVSSFVLLSEVHAQFQCDHKSDEDTPAKVKEDRMVMCQQIKDACGKTNGFEIQLGVCFVNWVLFFVVSFFCFCFFFLFFGFFYY